MILLQCTHKHLTLAANRLPTMKKNPCKKIVDETQIIKNTALHFSMSLQKFLQGKNPKMLHVI